MKSSESLIGSRFAWSLIIASAVIMMITNGSRMTTGLFLSPINTSTGLGVVSISLAMAIGHFVWGVAQPVFGALADRHGPDRAILLGGLMLAIGTALTPFVDSQWGLIATMGILSAAGAGGGSFSTLIGTTSQQLAPQHRSFATGVVNAGGSIGQLVFAPLLQAIINTAGWMAAMFTVTATALCTLPLAWPLRRRGSPAASSQPASEAGTWVQIRTAFMDRSYLCIHASFMTCGFHNAFLVTHMPGEVALCGLPAGTSAASIALIGLFNIFGSLAAGALSSRFRMKYVLATMYAGRSAIVLAYLSSPKTPTTLYVFSAALGLTWLATVPPTAGLVSKLFGVRHISTLFGMTLLSHQTGAFFGAWMGGVALAHSGDYVWIWWADLVLAILAALVSLAIHEKPIRSVQQA